jgi:hypothetical protein
MKAVIIFYRVPGADNANDPTPAGGSGIDASPQIQVSRLYLGRHDFSALRHKDLLTFGQGQGEFPDGVRLQ